MLDTEIIIKRLALIKYLYKLGLEQSRQVETLASFSILSFHDSIEMCLKLIAEHNNIKSDNFSFLDYWSQIPTLTLKESMRNLNARRVNIKHKGLLPSKSDIEISRVNTSDFFEQNVIVQLGIEFKDISLLTLISNEKVRVFLEEAQKALEVSQNKSCIEKASFAFEELLYTYENNKINYFRHSPFSFGEDLSFNSSFFMHIEDRKMAQFVDKVKGSLEGIQKAIKIISFGIDYKRFVKFNMLTPKVIRRFDNDLYLDETWVKKKWTKENCQYCIDFVLDCSLKLQEFDFDIEEIDEPMPLPKQSNNKKGN